MPQFSEEAKARIAEAQERLDAAQARNAEKLSEQKARDKLYRDQLAKMPDWSPGSRKSRSPIINPLLE